MEAGARAGAVHGLCCWTPAECHARRHGAEGMGLLLVVDNWTGLISWIGSLSRTLLYGRESRFYCCIAWQAS